MSQLKLYWKFSCSNAFNIKKIWIFDSNERAYGVCLYMRTTDCNNNTACKPLCPISNVARLKKLTKLSLEICAPRFLSNLYKNPIGAFNKTVNGFYIWTDNSIVIRCVKVSPKKWKIFVGNIVALIQEAICWTSWRHVPFQNHSADLISSGIETTTLLTSSLWWKVTHWLPQESYKWPKTEINKPTEKLEIRNLHIECLKTSESITNISLIWTV